MARAGRPLGVAGAALLGAAALAASCGGCAPNEAAEVHPVWPLPPAPPRVVHRKNLRGPDDVAKPGLLEGLGRLITGEPKVSLLRPHGVAVEGEKYLYVTDQELQAVMVFDLKSGRSTPIDRAGETYFVSPVGVAACGEVLAASDSALNAVFLLSPQGTLQRTLAKPGGFQRPTGLAYDAARGLLYVVDTLANEVCVFQPGSGKLVRRFGAHGTGPGEFNYPTHVFVDRAGRIFVTDSLNFRVQAFDPEGRFLFHIGKLGDASGHLAVPKGVGVDSFGHVYIVDSYFSTVQVFDQEGNFLLALGGPGEESGRFQVPAGLFVDADNRIYVCDSFNRRVQLLQYVGGPTDVENPPETP
ncbi:MAG TPA: 6-bladed beta-propeller [Phycisphaerae bacterium]|nr:6-bladed beta-propeller [Phycisphaerae bacterium]